MPFLLQSLAGYISTHTPLARRDCVTWLGGGLHAISTHTPLARRDSCIHILLHFTFHFYSHASCEARPGWLVQLQPLRRHFYSHASCEARPSIGSTYASMIGFLLTRLLRGATCERYSTSRSGSFLLTRPMRGATIAKYFMY